MYTTGKRYLSSSNNYSRTNVIRTLRRRKHEFSNYRTFFDLIFYENESSGEGKLQLISDKSYAFILQYQRSK